LGEVLWRKEEKWWERKRENIEEEGDEDHRTRTEHIYGNKSHHANRKLIKRG